MILVLVLFLKVHQKENWTCGCTDKATKAMIELEKEFENDFILRMSIK
jgi:hypothetical protein